MTESWHNKCLQRTHICLQTSTLTQWPLPSQSLVLSPSLLTYTCFCNRSAIPLPIVAQWLLVTRHLSHQHTAGVQQNEVFLYSRTSTRVSNSDLSRRSSSRRCTQFLCSYLSDEFLRVPIQRNFVITSRLETDSQRLQIMYWIANVLWPLYWWVKSLELS